LERQDQEQASVVFQTNNLLDDSGESTKWRRINAVFLKSQATTKSANYKSQLPFIIEIESFKIINSKLNRHHP
jgi:hypothetical protein